MFTTIQNKLARIVEKNKAEIQSALTRTLPPFFYAPDDDALTSEIPVFVFHGVDPVVFEKQMQYLSENGYKTLDADQLLSHLEGNAECSGRTVALTFDDATGSFWAVAYPLLKKYGFTAIVFVVPGLVPDDGTLYPTLDDVDKGQASIEAVTGRERVQPLCTWTELFEMHQSGFVDIQSHSMTHSRISISGRVVDFLYPGFDCYSFGNAKMPVCGTLSYTRESLKLPWGQPVYESASRVSGRLRFIEDPNVGDALADHIAEAGGSHFFSQLNWRMRLDKQFKKFAASNRLQTSYETREQMHDAIRQELSASKAMLESKLTGKQVKHFCYPWFQGSRLSDRIAGECGYLSVFYGMESNGSKIQGPTRPRRILRVSEEYLYCLPGRGRQSVGKVWRGKVMRSIKRLTKKNP